MLSVVVIVVYQIWLFLRLSCDLFATCCGFVVTCHLSLLLSHCSLGRQQTTIPTKLAIYSTQFPIWDGSKFYGEVEKPNPPNASEAIGKVVDLRMFVDSEHAGDQCTCQLHRIFLLYLNNVLIQWYSKRESAIEMYTFGADFLAMKTGIEALHGICDKLHLMGILIWCYPPLWWYYVW